MDFAGKDNEDTAFHEDSSSSNSAQGTDTSQPRTSVNLRQFTEDLRDCNWEQLEERYGKAMEEHGKSEEELRAQITKLLEVIYLSTCPRSYLSDCSIAGLCSMVSNHRHPRRGQSFEEVRQIEFLVRAEKPWLI